MNLPTIHSRLRERSLLLFAAVLFLLSLVSAWYFQEQPSINYHQKQLQHYVQKQEEDARGLLADNALMRRLALKTESLEEFKKIAAKEYGLFLFAETISEKQDLLFWNNQKILPPTADFSLRDGAYFQRLANGYYVVLKSRLRFAGMSNNIVAYVLIPVLNQYYLETDYLQTRFVHDRQAHRQVALSSDRTPYPVVSATDRVYFYLKQVTHPNLASMDRLTFIFRIVALIFLLVYFHLAADRLTRRSRALYGILFFSGVLILVRYLLFQFTGIFSFRQFELFDPNVYGASEFNPSLGDLLINTVFICWIVLFAWYNAGPKQRMPAMLKGNGLYAAGVAALFVLIFFTFQLANIVRSLVLDSNISFNVTNFFSLDFYTVIGLIVLALLSLSYYYFTRLLFRFIFPAFGYRYLYIYFALALTGLFFLTIRSGNTIVLFHLPVLCWLLVYTLLVSQEKFIINRFRITVAGALFWIFVFSISLAAVILQGNRQNELRVRKGIAEKFDQITDPSNDRTISIAITYLDNRFLVRNFHRFQNEAQNRVIRDSILRQNFMGYSTRYDTRIYVFDSLNRGINNDDPMSFPELNTIFTVQSKPTGVQDLNYHENSYDRFTYITRRMVRDSNGLIGSFFILSTLRQYGSTDAFYPELFRQVSRRDDPENSPVYAYAIYNNGLLISSSTKYPFQITLTPEQVPKSEFETVHNGEYDELWHKANNKKIVVIAKKRDSLIESITLFSYLFCAFLFMVGLLQIIAFILRLFGDHSFNFFAQINIRSQIHGTVIFISILSFLIIGAATISFFISRYNRNNIDRLSRTAGIMVKELQKRLSDTASFSPGVSDSAAGLNLQRLVDEVADIHNADVNVYDLDGNLQVSSEDEVYRKGILSTKMHPLAYYHLDRLRQVQHVQKEVLSSLDYWSIYSAVRNEKGEVVKYLNIPYFSSQIDLKQEISNFLVTIINLNAFIFLIAGVIALFITNKITRSFSVIGQKMKEITLGKTNEEIVWDRNDEIGELVTQYNKMVHQLEESAEALAKSEREGAWREMARQVAHEIKNPLTPMKLSIQYLQKASDSGQGNIKELTASVANTLIEQIDHLSKIAADFSQFANIGNKKIELVDLHQVIGILVDLYSSNPKVDISWKKIPGSVVMKADKTHMNRVFTNLLANAVDACHNNERCVLEINEEQKGSYVVIRITDNGEGIPEGMRSKIFTPNFTTKTSGTGLGLAMCKSIVEQAQGQIWFETEEGRGTSFFVQLPVIS
ncbi:MAG TPA: HAMP domain-containing sensor histidine kinase [Flavisolibacter sp.]|nr:HAMP domain-containing sensor histidine kinase [Flavisolibacter sp.]